MRKQKMLVLGIVFLMIFVAFLGMLMNVGSEGEYSSYFAGGTGTATEPYQISDVDELQNMNLDLEAHYILVNDIDASTTSTWNWNVDHYDGFEPIGTYPWEFAFLGTFDGNGYEITDLYINRPSSNYVGLFGNIAYPSEIKNIGLTNIEVNGGRYVGGLVGYTESCKITNSFTTGYITGSRDVGGIAGRIDMGSEVLNCYSTSSVSGSSGVGGIVGSGILGPGIYDSYATGSISGGSMVGGIIGFCEAIVSNCYATGSISGTYYVGGLAGGIDEGGIQNSYATGSVSGDNYVGGLAGNNYMGGILSAYATGSVSGSSAVGGVVGETEMGLILNSYATGSVSGSSMVGGLIGELRSGRTSNCYATGSVSGSSSVGGLVGYKYESEYGSVTNSFWDIETSGQSSSMGGTGKTTEEMKDVATFTDTSTVGLDSPWDFLGDPNDDTGSEDIWDIIDGITYPFLSWQDIPPDATGVINDYIQNLPDSAFKNNAEQRKKAFEKKLDAIFELIDAGEYEEAIDKLQKDIREKCDGSQGGKSENDWITDTEAQAELCEMIDALIVYLETLV
jgi:hypothetical protein